MKINEDGGSHVHDNSTDESPDRNVKLSKKELSKKYIELATLDNGKSFGDLALIGSKPRMASIRCLEDTHFAVLSKQDYNSCLGQIEKK